MAQTAEHRKVGALSSFLKAVMYIALGAAIGMSILGLWPSRTELRPHQTPWVTCDELKWLDDTGDIRYPRIYWEEHCGFVPPGRITPD